MGWIMMVSFGRSRALRRSLPVMNHWNHLVILHHGHRAEKSLSHANMTIMLVQHCLPFARSLSFDPIFGWFFILFLFFSSFLLPIIWISGLSTIGQQTCIGTTASVISFYPNTVFCPSFDPIHWGHSCAYVVLYCPKIFSILFIKQSEWSTLNNIMPRNNGKADPKTHLLLIECAKGWIFFFDSMCTSRGNSRQKRKRKRIATYIWRFE